MTHDDYDEHQDPSGRVALRAATKSNPRNLPCPDCGKKNQLTQADADRGFHCDDCEDRLELETY